MYFPLPNLCNMCHINVFVHVTYSVYLGLLFQNIGIRKALEEDKENAYKYRVLRGIHTRQALRTRVLKQNKERIVKTYYNST